eukprot:TRINITY_DN64597_c0_g1_i1.p1 TRINITY_DN64597_c0_g1~~TRINITY_DN64597_c0_g1_i1.p1  ORF type:complete len:384 (+),score=48.03 TRINITY_DN64597_c0_g1_i1:71-1222(+)
MKEAATLLLILNVPGSASKLQLHPHISEAPEAPRNDALSSAVCLPMVLMIALGVGFFGRKVAPYIFPGRPCGLVMCAVYVALAAYIDISIKMLATSGPESRDYAFNPVCVILVSETCKLMMSIVLAFTSGCHFLEDFDASKVIAFADVAHLMLPAVLLIVSNILVFEALAARDTSPFEVFRYTTIMWTAAVWKLFFRSNLGLARSTAILLVFSGIVVNYFTHRAAGKLSWASLRVIALTFCNAFASVANEFALKRKYSHDINIQNSVLYVLCILFSVMLLLLDDPSRLTSLVSFFDGFTSLSWTLAGVQACAGLLASRLLKYTDSLMKTSASCLRGPVLVLVLPCFGLGQRLDMSSLTSAILVAAGCLGCLSQGPVAFPSIRL